MAVNGSALSRIYTLNHVVVRVLNRLGIQSPKDNMKPKIVSEINAQQKIIAEKLIAGDDTIKSLYHQPASIAFVGGEQTFDNVEATNPLIKEVVDLIGINGDSTEYGSVPFLTPDIFKNVSNNVYYDNGIFYTMETRRVKVVSGQSFDATGMTFRLIYVRELNTLQALTDYMDLPSNKFDELVNAVVEVFATPDEK